ncbi:HAD hydrolase, family IIA [Propionibacterium sp. oral taxon 192 str. F0372]|nr:HAD hydrolase, family IIA [Propionibacterium sp. oral taxon 192 str. F0372]
MRKVNNRIIDLHDAVLLDLDGVVYLGPQAVGGAPESLDAARRKGIQIAFVTNNAARRPSAVADHLRSLGITCQEMDVVTSAQAITALMARQLAKGSKVLVCGTDALAEEATKVGFTIVESFTDEPVAVVQGYSPSINWQRFDEAAHAIQRGAVWYMSNTDPNRPTNLGMVPGAGAQMAVVAAAVDAKPVIAGKPFPPLLEATVERVGCQAPIFIGDRLDTDIEGANNVSMASMLVFTGAHGKYDLVSAPVHQRPTTIGFDLMSLSQPIRRANTTDTGWTCGAAIARIVGGKIEVSGVEDGVDAQLDVLWALANLCWAHPELDPSAALEELDMVP